MMKEDISHPIGVILVILVISWYSEGKLKLDKDHPTDETVTYLFNLTQIIEECLKNPTIDNGNNMLRSIYEYYNNLDDIYWMMKEEDAEVKQEAFRLFGKVLEDGEPIHIKTKVNFDHIKVKFEWNDRSVQEVYDAIRNCKLLWENVEFLYGELHFDDFDFVLLSAICLENIVKVQGEPVTEAIYGADKDLDKGTPNFLLNLGESLKLSLLNPTFSKSCGEETIKGLIDFHRNLNDIYDMLKSKDPVENKLGVMLFRVLSDEGGPAHLNLEFDIENAMNKFEWNNRDVFTVRKVIDETDALWENILIEAEKIKDISSEEVISHG